MNSALGWESSMDVSERKGSLAEGKTYPIFPAEDKSGQPNRGCREDGRWGRDQPPF